MFDKLEENNLIADFGCTPLHIALELPTMVFRKIEHVKDKNPRNNDGTTSLHNAAYQGHFQICQHIKNVDD